MAWLITLRASRRVDQVDLAVLALDHVRIRERVLARGDVAAIGIRLVLVGRNGHGQRRAIVHAVVVDQQQVAVLQLEEIDRGVGIGELRILPFAPGAAAVVRFAAHDVAVA